jgi:superfamily II DNA/RNA helicase
MTNFEKALRNRHQVLTEKAKKINLSNLTPIQSKAMKLLQENKNIFINQQTRTSVQQQWIPKTTYFKCSKNIY